MTDYAGFGTLLKVGDGGATEAFTTIGSVMDISGPSLGVDTAEVTNHSSTAAYEEFVATVVRTGDVTFTVNFDPALATHAYGSGLLEDMENKTKRNYQLVFPDTAATTWAFAAFVTGFSPSAPVAGALTADVSLKITGQPTLA
jgi:hypothetical protein